METDQEIHHLLHTLWTKAVGTADYDKEQWKRMSAFIEGHIQPMGLLNRNRLSDDPPPTSRTSRYERKPVI